MVRGMENVTLTSLFIAFLPRCSNKFLAHYPEARLENHGGAPNLEHIFDSLENLISLIQIL